jgi:hypothetical protein
MKNRGTWTAFLAAAFLVVGMMGLFATFAAPLPLERALAREDALDDALATEGTPDRAARLDALRDRLDDSAATVIDGKGDLRDRVAAARASMRVDLQKEADAVAARLRLLVVVVTLVAALFGAIAIGAGRAN